MGPSRVTVAGADCLFSGLIFIIICILLNKSFRVLEYFCLIQGYQYVQTRKAVAEEESPYETIYPVSPPNATKVR